MLATVSAFVAAKKPIVSKQSCSQFLRPSQAAICHGPWMMCSARDQAGKPVIAGRRCTSFSAIKDDVINAGAIWIDEPVVVDSNIITSRTPKDLAVFCKAIIAAVRG